MFFKNVIGQQHCKNTLLKHIQQNTIPHAQLFLGNEGTGGLAMAMAYSQLIHCENPSPNDSCGKCSACFQSQKMIHPDTHFSFPTISGKPLSKDLTKEWREAVLQNPYLNAFQWLQFLKADNKQGNITADECNSIIQKLSLKPYESTYKILIMWMPEYLGKEGNRLLKLIEEPPQNTILILVGENQEAIISTILSRTQTLKIPPLTDNEIAEALIQKNNQTPNRAQQIATLAEGNYNEAIALLENTNHNNEQLLEQWLQACLHKKTTEMAQWVEKITETGREHQKNFIKYTLHFFRHTLLLQFTNATNTTSKLTPNELNWANTLLQKRNYEFIENLSDSLSHAYYHIERNANPRILFFNLSIKFLENNF